MLAAVLLGLPLLPATTSAVSSAAGHPVSVIVRSVGGAGAAVESAVRRLGGTVGRRIKLIDGFAATVPAARLSELAAARGVHSVTRDGQVTLHHSSTLGFDASTDLGSTYNVARAIGADDAWRLGITGRGVDVALIDSGVVPVDGLKASGKVVNGADLSFESQASQLTYLDSYGHGTHMAGIIAGRDSAGDTISSFLNHHRFVGIAPGARIVNVKVASASGAADVSQVIAAIDWIVEHRRDSGKNIRLISMSFGTDSLQSYLLDPLAYAAEVAWRKGLVVVASAGNASFGDQQLNDPANDPYVIAVGASDMAGTLSPHDDVVPSFSARGTPTRRPDLVAPGTSVVSLRSPGSHLDAAYPGGRVGTRFFRGSGTSQSTAVVAGAVALLLQQRPHVTPDQVKKLLMSSASRLPLADAAGQGAGRVNIERALRTTTPAYQQTWSKSTGKGSLDLARGSARVTDGITPLLGEQNIFGQVWDPVAWPGASWRGESWSAGAWNGRGWSGSCWCRTSWSGPGWSTAKWSGTRWSKYSWSGLTWYGMKWDGVSWSGLTSSGLTWSGATRSRDVWSGVTWGRR